MSPALDHSARAHATFSPSSMGRILNCPVSVVISQGLPEESSSASDEGGLAHEVAELILDHKLNGTKLTIDSSKYNDEMIQHGEGYADFIFEVCANGMLGNFKALIERRVVIDKTLDIWGTADFILVAEDDDGNINLYVIDFKYGKGVYVSVHENWQFITYSIGAILEVESKLGVKVSKVTCAVYQPRVVNPDLTPIVYTRDELMGERLEKILDTTGMISEWLAEHKQTPIEEFAPDQFNAGSWCQFCKVQKNGLCSEYKRQYVRNLGDLVKKTMAAIPKGDIKKHDKVKPFLTEEERAFFALNRGVIRSFLDAVYNGVDADIDNGRPIKGLKKVETSDNYIWAVPERELILGLNKKGIEAYKTTKKLLTVPQARDLLGGIENLGRLVKVDGKNTKIVSDSDSREAVGAAKANKLMEKTLKAAK